MMRLFARRLGLVLIIVLLLAWCAPSQAGRRRHGCCQPCCQPACCSSLDNFCSNFVYTGDPVNIDGPIPHPVHYIKLGTGAIVRINAPFGSPPSQRIRLPRRRSATEE